MHRLPMLAVLLGLPLLCTASALTLAPRAARAADDPASAPAASGPATATAADATDPVDPFGFHESDYSSWGIVDAPYPYDLPAEYCFPIGNGAVSATLGRDGDFNTLTSIGGLGDASLRSRLGRPADYPAR